MQKLEDQLPREEDENVVQHCPLHQVHKKVLLQRFRQHCISRILEYAQLLDSSVYQYIQ